MIPEDIYIEHILWFMVIFSASKTVVLHSFLFKKENKEDEMRLMQGYTLSSNQLVVE